MLGVLIVAAIAATPAEAWPADLSTTCAKVGQPSRFYPDAAIKAVKNGQVILRCRTGEDRRYVGCEVIDERPTDLGFARAALKMARCDSPLAGAPGDVVLFPVHFRIPEPGPQRQSVPASGITAVAAGYWVVPKKPSR